MYGLDGCNSCDWLIRARFGGLYRLGGGQGSDYFIEKIKSCLGQYFGDRVRAATVHCGWLDVPLAWCIIYLPPPHSCWGHRFEPGMRRGGKPAFV